MPTERIRPRTGPVDWAWAEEPVVMRKSNASRPISTRHRPAAPPLAIARNATIRRIPCPIQTYLFFLQHRRAVVEKRVTAHVCDDIPRCYGPRTDFSAVQI